MDDKLLDKLKKLLDKAKSTDSEAEAQSFMNKVQEMLIENNLSMSSLESHTLNEKNAVIKTKFSLEELTDKRHGQWLSYLINGVAKAFLCQAILSKHGREAHQVNIFIIGRENNIAVVGSMIEYLQPTVMRLEREGWSTYSGPQKRGSYRRDFLLACALRISSRLKENQRKLEQENNKVTALIRVNDTAVAEFVSKEFPYLKRGKSANQKFRDGTFDGTTAGNKVNLNNQIGGSNKGFLN